MHRTTDRTSHRAASASQRAANGLQVNVPHSVASCFRGTGSSFHSGAAELAKIVDAQDLTDLLRETYGDDPQFTKHTVTRSDANGNPEKITKTRIDQMYCHTRN